MDAHELRAFRRARGLTQQQLAGLLDISQSMVSQMETGRCPIPTRERELAPGVPPDPSLREELEELLALDDEELRDWADGTARAPRGPYR